MRQEVLKNGCTVVGLSQNLVRNAEFSVIKGSIVGNSYQESHFRNFWEER